MANEETSAERIEKKLDLMIYLLSLLVDQKKIPSITDQIALLAARGLAPAEIGRIVGRESNYVSAVTKSRKVVKK